MLTQISFTSFQSGSSRSFLVGGLAAALAILSIVIDLEVSVGAARSAVESSAEIVTRTRKGDRLPLPPAFYVNAVTKSREINVPRAPASDSKLADGCESLVSSLAHSPLARVAGRCVS
jgi:hypothetical protein